MSERANRWARERDHRRDRLQERGSVAVETALASTIFCLILFGIVEFGLLISQSLAVSTSTRSGARVGAVLGSANGADYQILQSVRNSRSFMALDDISLVVVYKANADDGAVPTDCANGIPVAGLCNVYSAADFDRSATDLASSGRSDYWPAVNREQWSDHLGVYMAVKHSWLTNLFSSQASTIHDDTVMQIQPAVDRPWEPPAGDPSDAVPAPPEDTAPSADEPQDSDSDEGSSSDSDDADTDAGGTEPTGGGGHHSGHHGQGGDQGSDDSPVEDTGPPSDPQPVIPNW